jgi:phosphate transport system permease protein
MSRKIRLSHFQSQFQRNLRVRKWANMIFAGAALFILFLSLSLLLTLIVDLAASGIPRISVDFFSNFPSRIPHRAGILAAWVGTFLVMFVTALFAVPVGVGAGIYLEFYAKRNKLSKFIEINILNLAAIPSITFGLMALGLFVYRFKMGQSILTAGMTLGLLVLPLIIVSTREALRTVPQTIHEACFALGATKWQMIYGHLVPYSIGGILTGVIIALSRAIGETAPLVTVGALTFIAFLPSAPLTDQAPYVSMKWLTDPYTVMPIQMFDWVSRPQPEFHVNAAATGFVLLCMTLLLNGMAIYIRYQFRKKVSW